MALKDLPTEDIPFTEIIDDNYLYADKTKYIYQLLLRKKGQFFLSRPRRFGKSLLLDTLRELFTGNRQRFEGLWIGQSDYDFKAYPTLFLTLSVKSDNPSALENAILNKLKIATPEGLTVLGDTSDEYFENLIMALHAEFKSKVAVLIDEYDAPLTENLANFSQAGDLEKLREKPPLKEFEEYKEVKKKLKVFRLEAIRAGFKKAWRERDYAVIIAVADKIPNNVL
ncbi:MAG: AAA family ATPase [Deltaproteobacteria bacterium]|jgi:hypothetical protein|nr:AAA family ATPase [Deltaproteobacteria bacterium]